MSAAQLLRILQTIPSDVKNETCAYISAAQDMIMKENQNEIRAYDSKSSGRDCDPVAVGSKEMYQLNGLTRDTLPSLFEAKGTDKRWKPKTEDGFSIDYQESRDSGAEEFQNGPFCCLEDDKDSLSSDTNAENKVPRPEHDPPVAASDLFETEKNFFADKNVLEYEHPELIVCYKEINYHVVKDICVDDGMPASRKILSDSSKDSLSGYYFPQALDDTSSVKATGAVDEELLTSNGLEAITLQSEEFIIAHQLRSKKVSNGIKLDTQGLPKLPWEISLDTVTGCNVEESVQKGGMIFGPASKTSDEESFIDSALPIQEFGTRSFLRSFLNSLDGEGNTVKQLPDQFASGKVVSEDPAAASTEAWPKEDLQESILSYNSKVERRSITFNFNSLEPVVGGITNGKTALVEEVIDQKFAEADILSDSRQVEWSSKDTTSEEILDQSLQNKDGFPNDFSARSQPQSVSSNYMNNDNDLDQSLGCNDKESVDLSSNIDQLASSQSVIPLHSCNQATSSRVLQHQDRDPNNDPIVSLRRYDQGESCFSADSLTHSGPIAFSGSISLRSEGSGTSARSFAFPVLQGEWSSSPVRMTKADKRRFRKHKCWRSGLLCCRF